MDSRLSLAPEAPPFRWIRRPATSSFDHDSGLLTITAGARTDHFVDPMAQDVVATAPLLVADPHPPAMMSCLVSVADRQTFDAAALMVFADDTHWAKLALERSPDGLRRTVSVVTNGRSDDANHVVVPEGRIFLRAASLGQQTFALHSSLNGSRWDLLRYFRLDVPGFLALSSQSPQGEFCEGTFAQFTWYPQVVGDLRDGS